MRILLFEIVWEPEMGKEGTSKTCFLELQNYVGFVG